MQQRHFFVLSHKKIGKMQLFRPPWIWLARFRQRRGYGIHSPFAFDFVRGVVLESWPYYAYSTLARLHPWWVRALHLRPLACCRLLFRLANYAHPATVRLVAASPEERAYILAAVPSAREVETPAADLVFLGSGHMADADDIVPQMPPHGLLIVEGICHDRHATAVWHALQNHPQTGITFDLYTYGIIFFDRSRHKQHYIINF